MLGRVIVVSILLVICSGCSDLFIPESESDLNSQDLESAWTTVNNVYPFLQFKKINWDSLHTLYRKRVEQSRGDDIFFILSDLLAELKDGHVALLSRGGGNPVIPYQTPRQMKGRLLYSSEVVRNYLPLTLTGEGNMEFGLTTDNIGYLYIAAFKEGPWAYDIDNVLERLKNAKGLIVDVRNNGGGTTDAANIILGRFIEYQMATPVFYRYGVKMGQGTVPARGPFQWKKPTVVLINGGSFSTAEIFPEMMKQLPSVTAIGDTTGGGGGGV
jgi:hypothetical protein